MPGKKPSNTKQATRRRGGVQKSGAAANLPTRRAFTIEERKGFAESYDDAKMKKRAFCRKNNICRSTLAIALTKREELRKAKALRAQACSLKGPDNVELNDVVWLWLKPALEAGSFVTPGGVLRKAEELQKGTTIAGKPDASWWQRFQKYHAVRTLHKLHGEKAGADFAAAERFVSEFAEMRKKLEVPDDLTYNWDEALVSYRKFSLHHVVVLRESAQDQRGWALENQRVGLGVCISAAGVVLPPVICHSAMLPEGWTVAQRKAFEERKVEVKGKKPVSKPFYYRPTKTGWVGMHWFAEYIHDVFVPAAHKVAQMKRLRNAALLLMDGCTSHPSMVLMFVRAHQATGQATTYGDVRPSADGVPGPPLVVEAHHLRSRYPESGRRE